MPQHPQLLVTAACSRGHQRLETRLHPSPAALIAGLPTTSPLRCQLYPPMNDSRSLWTNSRGPATVSVYLAVFALSLAVFGLVVLSQRIWRFQFISATATAADR